MKRTFKITIDIDPSVDEPEVIIRAKEETALVREIASFAEKQMEKEQAGITVYKDGMTEEIDTCDIIRIYKEDRKMVVITGNGEYQARSSLQELEETLDKHRFLRISRSEIINLERVSGFDMSFRGTVKVIFEDGSYSWVSRRYVNTVSSRLAKLASAGSFEQNGREKS